MASGGYPAAILKEEVYVDDVMASGGYPLPHPTNPSLQPDRAARRAINESLSRRAYWSFAASAL